MRVVGYVQNQGGLARNDLKAPCQLGLGQADAHVLRSHGQAVVHGGNGGYRACCVDELVGAPQARPCQAAVAPPPARPAPLLLVALQGKVAPVQPQVGANGIGVRSQGGGRLWVAHNGRFARAHDAGFFGADGFARFAQKFGVVDVDAGDDGAVGIDQVHGVQPSAQAHLKNHGIQPGAGQTVQNRQCGEFEIGQRRAATGLLHMGKMPGQRGGVHRLVVDLAAFGKVHQVR